MAPRPAPQPKGEASSASSAAQPARQEPAGSAESPRHHCVNAVFGTTNPRMAPLQEVLEKAWDEYMQRFMRAWEEEKTSDEYKKRLHKEKESDE